MHNETDTVVFLGPSLPVAEARRILAARYEPPARLGSIYAEIAGEVTTILVVDGVFHNEPSVWQREVDAALQAGITVFGASSMGALRAAELHRFGMIGHGVVFGWYRDGVIEDDDEVALLHGDAGSGYRPLSEPMVNVRFTLERAVEDGVVPAAALAPVLETARRVYYPERGFPRLIADLRADADLAALAEPLERYVASHRVDVKRRDAISLLELVAERRRGEGAAAAIDEPARRDRFVVRSSHGHARLTDVWRRRGQELRRLDHEGRRWTLGEIWGLVEAPGEGTVEIPRLGATGTIALSPDVRRRLLDDRWARALAVEHARTQGLVPPTRYLELVTARLRAVIAPPRTDPPPSAASRVDAALVRWLRACRVTGPEFEERREAEAMAAWFADELPAAVARTTAEWDDPLATDPELEADVGVYLRVFWTDVERRACRRVALAALLDERDHELAPVPAAGWSGLLQRLADPDVAP